MVQKYDLKAEGCGEVKRVVRVFKGGAATMLGDGDIREMNDELGLVVGVRRVSGERGDWQLEVSY